MDLYGALAELLSLLTDKTNEMEKRTKEHIILTVLVIVVMACLTLMVQNTFPSMKDLPALRMIILESIFVLCVSVFMYIKDKCEETD